MLADVRTQVELLLDGNERRDTLSAFNVLAARAGVDLGATPATARSVRELFAAVSPAALGVSAKRYANIRSLIVRAVDRFGMKRTRLTSRVPLAPEWEALLARVENATYRQGVKRLAHYCSAMGIPPDEVRSGHLVGLHDGARGRVHDQAPAQGHQAHDRHVEPLRADGARLARGGARLALRRRSRTRFRSSGFPESFRADVARWIERVSPAEPARSRSADPGAEAGHDQELRRLLPPLRLGAGAAEHPRRWTRSPASRSSSRAATSRKACGTSCRPTCSAGDAVHRQRLPDRAEAQPCGAPLRSCRCGDAEGDRPPLPPPRPERAAGDGPAQPRPARPVRRRRERPEAPGLPGGGGGAGAAQGERRPAARGASSARSRSRC